MRLLALIPIVSTLLLASVAAAQPSEQPAPAEQSTEALARQYVMVGGAQDLLVEGAVYGFRQAVEAGGVRFTPNQWTRVRAAVRDGFRPAAELFVSELVTFMANSPREDLIAALDYYNTPAGQRYVAASIEYSFPLSVYLASQGRVPLQDAPAVATLDAARLAEARAVAALLVSKMHASERASIELTTFGVAGVEDYVARSLANSLALSDLEGARAWVVSPPSMRLEGPSAERTLAIQTASMRAMATVDVPALTETVQAIMREPPPT